MNLQKSVDHSIKTLSSSTNAIDAQYNTILIQMNCFLNKDEINGKCWISRKIMCSTYTSFREQQWTKNFQILNMFLSSCPRLFSA